MELKPVKGLRPFTKFLMTIGELPSSYLVSMTYEEQLLWFCNYLQNVVIPTINNNSEAVVELQEFVSNYFDNLDVQDEIDHKLNEMAESGELAEIIAAYISINAIFSYDTIADMAASDVLEDGNDVYCLGKDTYNDGKGAFYKIREITISDVIDGYNIVAITNSEDLIGERLPNYEINEINSAIDTINNTTIPDLQDQIDTINNTTIPGIQDDITTINETTIPAIEGNITTITETTIPTIEGDINTINNTTIPAIQGDISGLEQDVDELTKRYKMLIIGDSFSTGTASGTPLWYTYVADWHNLDYYSKAVDGCGYATGTKTFLQQLQEANSDSSLVNDDVKEIYILGGLNDIGNASLSDNDFATAVANTINYAEANFTKALIYVVGIFPFQWYNFYSGNACLTNNTRAAMLQAHLSYACLSNATTDRVIFKNAEYFGLTAPGYFGTANSSNQKHPSALGEKEIANFIENGEKQYGFTDALSSGSDLRNTPLVCSNGSASIVKVDSWGIGIQISNYVATNAFNLQLTGLPNVTIFLPVTDENGHFAFAYRDLNDDKYQMFANVGLNSGTIFMTIPWQLM